MTDAYPTNKYRLGVLREIFNNHVITVGVKGAQSKHLANSASGSIVAKLKAAMVLVLQTVQHVVSLARSKTDVVYVTYPAIFVVFFCPKLIRLKNSHLYIDAFISIYDTVVNDRRLLKGSSIAAKLLFHIEKRCFLKSTKVIVDTKENALFYADIFNIPVNHFLVVPLHIPAPSQKKGLTASKDVSKEVRSPQSVNCLFVGTLVPLQGVLQVVAAAKALENQQITITVIGDGQDARLIDEYLAKHDSISNLVWIREFLSHDEISDHIHAADICLGIFGKTNKTARVVPYKIYHYLAHNKPVITLSSPAITDLKNQLEHKPDSINIVEVNPTRMRLSESIEQLASSLRETGSSLKCNSYDLFCEALSEYAVQKILETEFLKQGVLPTKDITTQTQSSD